MSVRIGLLKDGILETVYCLYPKDIKQLGKLLKEDYTKVSQIKELLKLGDLHTLKNNTDNSIFYIRDKNDPPEACHSYLEDASDLQSINTSRSPIDYYLIWTNKWNICEANKDNWTSVTKFLNKLK